MTCLVYQADFVQRFTCLGAECEDTCCRGWSVQVDSDTLIRYQREKPELMASIIQDPLTGPTLKKHGNGSCVQLQDGLCGIHKNIGEQWLGDACYLFPRVTRALGNHVAMTAMASCPEIARLALFDPATRWSYLLTEAERVPRQLRNYLSEDADADAGWAVHTKLLAILEDDAAHAEQWALRLVILAQSFDLVSKAQWEEALPFYLTHADNRLPAAEPNISDPVNLLHTLCGLTVSTRHTPSERLLRTTQMMEKALHVTLAWDTAAIYIAPDTHVTAAALYAQWDAAWNQELAPVLKRWLLLQISSTLFPYAGLGDSVTMRATIIAVRLAIVKLALMCERSVQQAPLSEADIVRCIQSIMRILDHITDPAFTWSIYEETGWTKLPRLHAALIGPGTKEN